MNTLTIRATVTKTMTIEANSADEAAATANDLFTTECEGPDEDFNRTFWTPKFSNRRQPSNGPHQ
jgi:hypothetical protein